MVVSGSLDALQRHAVRGDLGIDTLQGRRDKAKLKWWYKLVTMPKDRYRTQRSCLVRTGTSSHIEVDRGSRINNDLFVSLE